MVNSNSSVDFMLPVKRAVGTTLEVDSESSSLTKKHRSFVSTATSATGTSGVSAVNMGGGNVDGNNGVNNGIGGRNGKAPIGGSQQPDIDEDLHSRQLAVYGRETMRRLFASNILVSGLQGLGAEVAKNLILAGVKSVTLHDEGNVELWDLSSSFIFSEEDLGKNRALASVQKLQELNNAVVVYTLTDELSKEQLSNFQAVVFTDISLDKAIEYDDYCHKHQPPIAFIKSEVRGLFGSVFCDFGPEFTVFDVDGEDPRTGIIASISNDNPALVACVDD
ncbi:Ubiquitin-activating enzyme E1 2 [Abeliophyllum distichum]|uniref:Ubiquitin-activating enzyme E1 2 n=1 Tax=Abeliophyllum distichum TaxID=126358 RepID=A0ABD1VVM3_9LAMI